jgi:hypothetical protein
MPAVRPGSPMFIRGRSSQLISAIPNLRCEDQGSYEEIIGIHRPIFKQICVIFPSYPLPWYSGLRL